MPPAWLTTLAWVSLAAGLLSASVIGYDIVFAVGVSRWA
jgi:hypothetical protein